MPLRRFVLYSTLGALPWSMVLIYAGTVLGEHWLDIRHALQPFDTAILIVVVLAVVAFIWWRLGRPGWRGRTAS
jgi:membrane protein DedA with SNARE-associated domain